MKYKGGKRTDRGPISYRVKGRRLKVNASKSYPVHLLVLLLFSLTLSVPREWGKRENSHQIARVHLLIWTWPPGIAYRVWARVSNFGSCQGCSGLKKMPL